MGGIPPCSAKRNRRPRRPKSPLSICGAPAPPEQSTDHTSVKTAGNAGNAVARPRGDRRRCLETMAKSPRSPGGLSAGRCERPARSVPRSQGKRGAWQRAGMRTRHGDRRFGVDTGLAGRYPPAMVVMTMAMLRGSARPCSVPRVPPVPRIFQRGGIALWRRRCAADIPDALLACAAGSSASRNGAGASITPSPLGQPVRPGGEPCSPWTKPRAIRSPPAQGAFRGGPERPRRIPVISWECPIGRRLVWLVWLVLLWGLGKGMNFGDWWKVGTFRRDAHG
jgi:hypothetical protein